MKHFVVKSLTHREDINAKLFYKKYVDFIFSCFVPSFSPPSIFFFLSPFYPATFPLFLSLSSRSLMEYSAGQAKEHRLLLEENRE